MTNKLPVLMMATAFVMSAAATAPAAHAQAERQSAIYAQGADRQADTYEYLQKNDEKFDPYTQGANSTASALKPGAEPNNIERSKYDPYTQGARTGDADSPAPQGSKQ